MIALEQALVKMSYLLVDFPEILEMDINPLQVRTDGVCALDARIVIEPKDVRKIALPGRPPDDLACTPASTAGRCRWTARRHRSAPSSRRTSRCGAT